MRRWWAVLWLLPLMLELGVPSLGQESGAGPVLSATVSRTAIHVGDVFEYRLLVRYPSGVSFVTQDLEKTLVVRPFELLNVKAEQSAMGREGMLEVVLRLTCYEKPGRLEIPAFSLFYYPSKAVGLPGQGPAAQKDIPAKELVVPPQSINLQSTLLGEEERLRDSVTPVAFPLSVLVAPAVAAVLLFGILIWLVVLGTRALMKLAQPKTGIDEEKLRREALDTLRNLQRTAATDGKQPGPCLEVAKVVRGYLGARYGFNCQALTPAETREMLSNGVAGDFTEKVEALLERCDQGFFNRSAAPVADVAALCEQATALLRSAPRDAK